MSGQTEETAVDISCRDGIVLGGHLWRGGTLGRIIINPATGAAARYYHRYARFLARQGLTVLTYDYRGIGLSRPVDIKRCCFRWRDWGEGDFAEAVRFMEGEGPLTVIGHSIGGFLIGLAENAGRVDRVLTVGAQYAWWGDYAPGQRLGLFVKWHVVMPLLTAVHGYFPGRRLGWLEDLPAGVANEWSFRGPGFETSHPRAERAAVLARMGRVTAPILAVAISDDALGTVPAIQRTLGYYRQAPRTIAGIQPGGYGCAKIGHFDLFHDRHMAGFWRDSLSWLCDGVNPWSDRIIASAWPGGSTIDRLGAP